MESIDKLISSNVFRMSLVNSLSFLDKYIAFVKSLLCMPFSFASLINLFICGYNTASPPVQVMWSIPLENK